MFERLLQSAQIFSSLDSQNSDLWRLCLHNSELWVSLSMITRASRARNFKTNKRIFKEKRWNILLSHSHNNGSPIQSNPIHSNPFFGISERLLWLVFGSTSLSFQVCRSRNLTPNCIGPNIRVELNGSSLGLKRLTSKYLQLFFGKTWSSWQGFESRLGSTKVEFATRNLDVF